MLKKQILISFLSLFFSFHALASDYVLKQADLKIENSEEDNGGTLYYYSFKPCVRWSNVVIPNPHGFLCFQYASQNAEVPEISSLINIIKNFKAKMSYLEQRIRNLEGQLSQKP